MCRRADPANRVVPVVRKVDRVDRGEGDGGNQEKPKECLHVKLLVSEWKP